MNGWENFFLAQVGASAALAGLIFVGVSINLSKILSQPRLPNRAFEALLILLTVLVISSVLLVPGQSLKLVGSEVLLVGLSIWLTTLRLDLNSVQKLASQERPQYRRRFLLLLLMNQITILPYIIAGVVILMGSLNGLYWLVLAILFSFVKAILDAWVLLVEIHR
jgi:modulator of FtsH protease